MTRYRDRELAPLIHEALRSLPVVVVTGLRQVGKTTLLQGDALLRERRYLTLDDYATLEETPAVVPPGTPPPVVLFDGVWIARNRYRWFGKTESCWLPTPELKARFLG